MAGDRTLKVTILGDDRSASKALKGVGDSADLAGSKIDKFGEKWGPRLAVAGAAVGVFGTKLTHMADESKQATAQLTTAIENAGGSMDRFGPKITAVSEKMIDLGHDDEAAARAMATLATATQDPTKAIEAMGLVADIAAARHISLESAADKLAKGYAGNTKVFKEFGITLAANATDAEKAAAMTELQARVSGQAAAQADNLTTKLTALRTRVENVAEAAGSTLGPVLTVAGSAVAGLGGISQATNLSLGDMTKKVGAVVGPMTLGAAAAFGLQTAVDALAPSVSKAARALAETVPTAESFDRALEKLRKPDLMDQVWLGLSKGPRNFSEINVEATKLFRTLAEDSPAAARMVVQSMEDQGREAGEFRGILDSVTLANAQGADAAKEQAIAEAELSSSFDKAKDSAAALKLGLDELVGVHISATRANIDYEAKVDDLTESFVTNGTSLDQTTEAGRKNIAAVLDLIESTGRLATAQLEEGAASDAVTVAYEGHIAQLRGVLQSAGLTADEIENLISKYGRIPRTVTTNVVTNYKSFFSGMSPYEGAMASGGQVPQHFAAGGGPRGTDTVPAWLTPGEFVIRKSAAQRIGLSNLTAMNRMASGGAVGSAVGGGHMSGQVLQLVLNTGELIGSVVLPGLLQLQGRQDLGIKAS